MSVETRPWGWTGFRVPKLGQGTWKMEGDAKADVVAALRVSPGVGTRFSW